MSFVENIFHYAPPTIGGMLSANTSLQERLLLGATGLGYFLLLAIGSLVVRKLAAVRISGLIVPVLLLHVMGSAIARLLVNYSYDIPFIGPWFQYADVMGLLLLFFWAGTFLFKNLNDGFQRVAAGFCMLHVAAMVVFFIFGYPSISIKIANVASFFLVTSLIVFTFRKRATFEGFWPFKDGVLHDFRFYVLILTVAPVLVYFASPAPPDRDVMLSADLLGYAVNSKSLLHALTGFGSEEWRIRYPAGIVGAFWLPSILFAGRAAESSLIMWVFGWVLYVSAMITVARRYAISSWFASLFCVNLTVTGYAALHGGQVQEVLSYSLGVFSLIWLLQSNYLLASFALFSVLVLHPIVALPFFLAAVVFQVTIVMNEGWISFRKFIGPNLIVFVALVYLLVTGFGGDQGNPSQPILLLKEATAGTFFTNLVRWITSDSLNLWWLGLIGLLILFKGTINKKADRIILLSWLVGALLIDGLFGATKWVVRFHSDFSTIGIWQLGWSAAACFVATRVRDITLWKRAVLLIMASVVWITANHFSLGFPFVPQSVFLTHSDVRLMRRADGSLPQGATIFNLRPPGNPFDWGGMCRGETFRACWNHGYGLHEIASGNSRGLRQNKCQHNSEDFVSCLRSENFQYVLVPSRANSNDFVAKIQNQGATVIDSVKSSYLLKVP